MGIKDRENKRMSAVAKMAQTIEDAPPQATAPQEKEKGRGASPPAPAGSAASVLNLVQKEYRTKRINTVLTPSLHAAAVAKCDRVGVKLNDCLNQLLEIWVNADE